MASTFKRVNAVVVDPIVTRIGDAYIDAGFATGGAYAANLATELNTVASTGACFRGMPVAIASSTGKLVPINLASGTASTAAARFAGVLLNDLTAYAVARGTKFAIAKSGRVRSYAGGALVVGQPVKPDTAAAFGGFVAWVSGTDTSEQLAGWAFPIADGSDGSAPTTTMAQGDQIFVDLIGV